MRTVIGGDGDSTKVKSVLIKDCYDTQYYCYRSSAGSTAQKIVIDQSTDTSSDCY